MPASPAASDARTQLFTRLYPPSVVAAARASGNTAIFGVLTGGGLQAIGSGQKPQSFHIVYVIDRQNPEGLTGH